MYMEENKHKSTPFPSHTHRPMRDAYSEKKRENLTPLFWADPKAQNKGVAVFSNAQFSIKDHKSYKETGQKMAIQETK